MPSNCKSCTAEDTEFMVQCDVCDNWYHFTCVRVDSTVAEREWRCDLCSPTPLDSQRMAAGSSKNMENSASNACDKSSQNLTLADAMKTPTLPTFSLATHTYTTSTAHGNISAPSIAQSTCMQPVNANTVITCPSNVLKTTSRISAPCFTSAMPHVQSPFLSTSHNNSNSAQYVNSAQQQYFAAPPSVGGAPLNDSLTQLGQLEEQWQMLQRQYIENKNRIRSLQQCSSAAVPTAAQLAARQAIPKHLPTFAGDPEDWPLFINTYEHSTATAGYTNAENLVRLQACLKGKAKEIVKHKLYQPSMVPEVIQTLRMCFGRPEHILERAINKARGMQPVKDKLDALIEFALSVRNICASMENCDMYTHLHNPLLVKELVDKLPNNQRLNWAMYPKPAATPIVKVFSDWLYQMAEAATTIVSFAPSKGSAVNTHRSDEGEPQPCHSNPRIQCKACDSDQHKVPSCEIFKNLPLSSKWEMVKAKALCRQCLGAHKRKCFSNRICGIDGCSSKHHSLLHNSKKQSNEERQPHASGSTTGAPSNQSHCLHASKIGESQPIFRIIPINVHFKDKFMKIFALLDEGSAVTLIEKSIFDELGINGVQNPLCLRWTGGTTRTEHESVTANITVSNITSGQKFKLTDVRSVNNLGLTTQSIDAVELANMNPYLKGLPIQSYVNERPVMLIGANNWKVAVPLKIREGSWRQPIATKTRLGWTLQGSSSGNASQLPLNVHMCDCQRDLKTLHEEVAEHFKLEASRPQQLLSDDDRRAVLILEKTVRKTDDNRFEVGLPWRAQIDELPDSYGNACKRLECLLKSCEKDPNLKCLVQEQVNNLVLKGYAEKLPAIQENNQRGKVWYLPTFIVKNPNKPDKVRLVWDAAAKANGTSLNDLLLSGPDLLTSLVDVLLAFRVGKVAMAADIAEMFHRINVREEDMHVQRFLWWDEGVETQKPSVYVMRALSFGLSCAPFIAHFVRNKNAEAFKETYPRAVEAIQYHHYVDDFIDSEDDEHKALELARQVKLIHNAGGFDIRKWSSNSSLVVAELTGDPQLTQSPKEWCSTTKILGMLWNPTKDIFEFHFRFARLRRDVVNEALVPTKRELLQVLMSIFDPLGFVSCYTIELKILLQKVWRSGIDWDEPLSSALYAEWCHWKTVVPLISMVEIPRCYSPFLRVADQVELHVFVDAGENGYAAVCYARVVQGQKVSVSLVAAKAKVAPLKPVSIPRLELQAAVVGVRLANMVLNVRRIQTTSQTWWTDSKTVLKWLHMDPKNFQQFVMHRVGEILESSKLSQWRWVPTKQNPADLATKVTKQSNKELWFKGPEFLFSERSAWPCDDDLEPCEAVNTELKHSVLTIQTITTNITPNVEYFSDWRRLYRAVATFILYIEKLKAASKHEEQPHSLSLDIIQGAKQYLLKLAQQEEYAEEISDLKLGKNVKKKSPLTNLNIYLDVNGIIRIRSRTESINNHEDVIVLPRTHHVALLIVRSIHVKYHHQMHETIINEVRGRYYISRLRALYKRVRHVCQYCKNMNSSPQTPQMATLPPARLAVFERPFTYVGVDFFGPITITVGRRREKRWGMIFTCLTVRAVHIEVAHSLDASSCIMAIRNFISRRGTPLEIYSDNGTNFKAASKVICCKTNKTDTDAILSTFDHIKWKFNPPSAPHMGGAWERLVRSIKTVLQSLCPSMKFNDESLRCSLNEVEHIINSRPLTFVSLESADDEAITPNHLLLGSADGYKPFLNDEADLRQRWRCTQQFADHFWRRWLKEYVPVISRRTKWFDKKPPLNVGDVVVVADAELPRNCWPKGVIIDTTVAKDGQVRRAVVKTAKGTLQRPAAKLAVLDVSSHEGKLTDRGSLTEEGMLLPSEG